jgi:uncharacterized membrane protein
MLILLLAGAVVLAFFLFGTLVTAVGVTMRHRDSSATYKLDAVRDRLISTCVFDGIPRDNQWLETLYSNVSSVLLQDARKLCPLPEGEKCPPELCALQPELRDALEHLLRHHKGSFLRMSSPARQQRRRQLEQARNLLEMIEQNGHPRRLPRKLRFVSRLMSVAR